MPCHLAMLFLQEHMQSVTVRTLSLGDPTAKCSLLLQAVICQCGAGALVRGRRRQTAALCCSRTPLHLQRSVAQEEPQWKVSVS